MGSDDVGIGDVMVCIVGVGGEAIGEVGAKETLMGIGVAVKAEIGR